MWKSADRVEGEDGGTRSRTRRQSSGVSPNEWPPARLASLETKCLTLRSVRGSGAGDVTVGNCQVIQGDHVEFSTEGVAMAPVGLKDEETQDDEEEVRATLRWSEEDWEAGSGYGINGRDSGIHLDDDLRFDQSNSDLRSDRSNSEPRLAQLSSTSDLSLYKSISDVHLNQSSPDLIANTTSTPSPNADKSVSDTNVELTPIPTHNDRPSNYRRSHHLSEYFSEEDEEDLEEEEGDIEGVEEIGDDGDCFQGDRMSPPIVGQIYKSSTFFDLSQNDGDDDVDNFTTTDSLGKNGNRISFNDQDPRRRLFVGDNGRNEKYLNDREQLRPEDMYELAEEERLPWPQIQAYKPTEAVSMITQEQLNVGKYVHGEYNRGYYQDEEEDNELFLDDGAAEVRSYNRDRTRPRDFWADDDDEEEEEEDDVYVYEDSDDADGMRPRTLDDESELLEEGYYQAYQGAGAEGGEGWHQYCFVGPQQGHPSWATNFSPCPGQRPITDYRYFQPGYLEVIVEDDEPVTVLSESTVTTTTHAKTMEALQTTICDQLTDDIHTTTITTATSLKTRENGVQREDSGIVMEPEYKDQNDVIFYNKKPVTNGTCDMSTGDEDEGSGSHGNIEDFIMNEDKAMCDSESDLNDSASDKQDMNTTTDTQSDTENDSEAPSCRETGQEKKCTSRKPAPQTTTVILCTKQYLANGHCRTIVETTRTVRDENGRESATKEIKIETTEPPMPQLKEEDEETVMETEPISSSTATTTAPPQEATQTRPDPNERLIEKDEQPIVEEQLSTKQVILQETSSPKKSPQQTQPDDSREPLQEPQAPPEPCPEPEEELLKQVMAAEQETRKNNTLPRTITITETVVTQVFKEIYGIPIQPKEVINTTSNTTAKAATEPEKVPQKSAPEPKKVAQKLKSEPIKVTPKSASEMKIIPQRVILEPKKLIKMSVAEPKKVAQKSAPEPNKAAKKSVLAPKVAGKKAAPKPERAPGPEITAAEAEPVEVEEEMVVAVESCRVKSAIPPNKPERVPSFRDAKKQKTELERVPSVREPIVVVTDPATESAVLQNNNSLLPCNGHFLDANVIADLVYRRFRPNVDKRKLIVLLFPPPYQQLGEPVEEPALTSVQVHSVSALPPFPGEDEVKQEPEEKEEELHGSTGEAHLDDDEDQKPNKKRNPNFFRRMVRAVRRAFNRG